MNDSSYDLLNQTSDIKSADLEKILIFQEKEHIEKHSKEDEWQKKYQILKKLKLDLNNKDLITYDDFKLLKEHAITKGGFLTNDLRRVFYKKIFCVDFQEENYELFYIDEEKEETNIEKISNYDVFKIKTEPFDLRILFHNIIIIISNKE
jgi:hypothetical protein